MSKKRNFCKELRKYYIKGDYGHPYELVIKQYPRRARAETILQFITRTIHCYLYFNAEFIRLKLNMSAIEVKELEYEFINSVVKNIGRQ